MYTKAPLKKTLTAKQKTLPLHLQEKIKAAPTKRLKYCGGKSAPFKRKKY